VATAGLVFESSPTEVGVTSSTTSPTESTSSDTFESSPTGVGAAAIRLRAGSAPASTRLNFRRLESALLHPLGMIPFAEDAFESSPTGISVAAGHAQRLPSRRGGLNLRRLESAILPVQRYTRFVNAHSFESSPTEVGGHYAASAVILSAMFESSPTKVGVAVVIPGQSESGLNLRRLESAFTAASSRATAMML
jgi:hypothetical protein